ncbi:toxin-antitoxin system YwqK family antitoxin [Aquimarina sp. 433]
MNKFLFYLVLFISFGCSKEKKSDLDVTYNSRDFLLQNGVLQYKGTPFSGIITSSDSVYKITTKISYLAGKKHGEEIKTYDNTTLAEKRFYQHGKKTDTHKGWWKNGQLKFQYEFNNQGEYHGKVAEWYQNGQQSKVFHFINGKEDGSQKMWSSNGKIRANYVAKNGERYGLIGLKKCYTVSTNDETYK